MSSLLQKWCWESTSLFNPLKIFCSIHIISCGTRFGNLLTCLLSSAISIMGPGRTYPHPAAVLDYFWGKNGRRRWGTCQCFFKTPFLSLPLHGKKIRIGCLLARMSKQLPKNVLGSSHALAGHRSLKNIFLHKNKTPLALWRPQSNCWHSFLVMCRPVEDQCLLPTQWPLLIS